ncbi:hypothetical protein HDU76_003885 [Blyttiomyces sp. JEL0837]|nr:hypothetical protein HDU76_003885 [Blyttiomyces sp. JEL0837]
MMSHHPHYTPPSTSSFHGNSYRPRQRSDGSGKFSESNQVPIGRKASESRQPITNNAFDSRKQQQRRRPLPPPPHYQQHHHNSTFGPVTRNRSHNLQVAGDATRPTVAAVPSAALSTSSARDTTHDDNIQQTQQSRRRYELGQQSGYSRRRNQGQGSTISSRARSGKPTGLSRERGSDPLISSERTDRKDRSTRIRDSNRTITKRPRHSHPPHRPRRRAGGSGSVPTPAGAISTTSSTSTGVASGSAPPPPKRRKPNHGYKSNAVYAGLRRAKEAQEKAKTESGSADGLDLGRSNFMHLMAKFAKDKLEPQVTREELLAQDDGLHPSNSVSSEDEGSHHEGGFGSESEEIDFEVDEALANLGLDVGYRARPSSTSQSHHSGEDFTTDDDSQVEYEADYDSQDYNSSENEDDRHEDEGHSAAPFNSYETPALILPSPSVSYIGEGTTPAPSGEKSNVQPTLAMACEV